MLIEETEDSEHWKELVAHTWSGSYLIKNSGWHYRKAMRVLGKALIKAASDWTGHNIWGSPIVALAPPFTLKKQRNNVYVRECSSRASPYALLGVSIGAREAKISYSIIYETKDGTRD